jgi:hypothetical protein
MPKRNARFYFGRLNVISARNEKTKLINEGLTANSVLEKRGQRWGFFKVREVETDDTTFIHGYLIKYRPRTEEVAVPETRELNGEMIENLVVAKSRFFLHPRSLVIAYHPSGGQITKDSAQDLFKCSVANWREPRGRSGENRRPHTA